MFLPSVSRTKFSLFLCFSLLLLCSAEFAQSRGISVELKDLHHKSGKLGNYKALVIGINKYSDPAITDLDTAVNDAQSLADVLEGKYGFDTNVLLNEQASREAIYTALRTLAADSTPDDSVLIYFAGHGDIDRQYNDGWWIPADAKGGKPLTYLDNTQVQKAMRNMKARHVLLISDSCYSGTLFGNARSIPPVIDNRYYLSLYNEKSRWGMTSGNKEPVTDDGTDGHSIFAYQLLKELENNQKPYLSTQDLYTRIAPIIGNNSEQTPICRPIRNTGDQGGEFIFIQVAGGNPKSITDGVAAPPLKEQKGVLKITSIPSGASVYINNKVAGETPVQVGNMSTGSVTVKVQKSGYIAQSQQTQIQSGRRAVLSFDLQAKKSTGWLTVKTNPAGAKIRILNIKQNYSSGMELGAGKYQVEVSKTNYQTEKRWLELAAGDDIKVNFTLTRQIASAKLVKSTPTKASTKKYPQIYTDPITGMEFIFVQGGCYQMGDTFGDGRSDEKPAHEVCVDDFYLGKYEVTQGQYQKITGKNPAHFKQGSDYPVEQVSWTDTYLYIRKINSKSGKRFRLPTEAEWEYAARSGGKNEKYAGASSPDGVAWYEKNSGGSTHKVGTKKPNGLGVYDMSGNVWEWCQDWYKADYYTQSPKDNPAGLPTGGLRVIRGGGWSGSAGFVRAANRLRFVPDVRNNLVGFRLLLQAE